MFGVQCEIHLPWQVVDQLQEQFDFIMTMGSSNTDYSAITCAGIQLDSLKSFTGEEDIGQEFASDVLGEFLNTYDGMLGDNKQFQKHFGTLLQAIPILYSEGEAFLPFIWGIHGYLYKDEHWIYLGFSIRPKSDKSNRR